MSGLHLDYPDLDLTDTFLTRVEDMKLLGEGRSDDLDVEAEIALLQLNGRCVGCGEAAAPSALYCEAGDCAEIGKAVRYIRGAIADGRIDRTDVREAIGIKLLSILSGGYDASGRSLTEEQRLAIFERDGGLCQLCGRPANRVDHIEGSSDDPANLRLLCEDCNRLLPFAHAAESDAEVSEEDRDYQEAVWDNMARRVASSKPIQLLDIPGWKSASAKLRGYRRRALSAQLQNNR